MSNFAHCLNQCSPAWWEYALHATWQAALTTAILLGLAALGRKWPAPWRYGVLLVALLKFAVPPFVSVPSGAFSQLGPRVAASAPAKPGNQPSVGAARDSHFARAVSGETNTELGMGRSARFERVRRAEGFRSPRDGLCQRRRARLDGLAHAPALCRLRRNVLLDCAPTESPSPRGSRQPSSRGGATAPLPELAGRRVEDEANSCPENFGPACGAGCLRSPSPDHSHAGNQPLPVFGTRTEGHSRP